MVLGSGGASPIEDNQLQDCAGMMEGGGDTCEAVVKEPQNGPSENHEPAAKEGDPGFEMTAGAVNIPHTGAVRFFFFFLVFFYFTIYSTS